MCTHQADASNAGLGHGTLTHVGGFLPEEEIQLVVVPLCAVRDEVHVNEGGIYVMKEKEKRGEHSCLKSSCWLIRNTCNHHNRL